MSAKLIPWLVLILTGCVSVVDRTSPHSVLNNTRFLLKITQDGQVIADGVPPGETVAVFAERELTVLTAAAYDQGQYVGAAAVTFYYYRPLAWVVNRVELPHDRP